ENNGASALGTFAGLAEGATLPYNGTTLQITYQGGAGTNVMLTATAVLPLDLLSFTGRTREKTNLLTWTTANEEDFSHFAVQRSLTATDWATVGTIPGEQQGTYTFEEEAQTAYYRLKMIDLDGTFSYSEVVRLENKTGAIAGAMRVYPNPSNGRFTVDLSGVSRSAGQSGKLGLVDMHGRTVWSADTETEQVLSVELLRPAPGVYLLSFATASSTTLTRRIIIH
ncbi:MAG: T9SS type A sorting domain-containing protein, partial [Bacteroidota bacterium]